MLEHWGKVQLMGVLSASLNLKSYLEITTTMTGGKYGEARDLSFEPCMRLVYRTGMWPRSDGLPIDFSSRNEDITTPLAEIRARGLTFDLVFVDAHHTYECAMRDLEAAYSLLNKNGVIVIHDCNPPTREIASPKFNPKAWCGLTYKSFIDFGLGNAAIDYLTFDADYGCGIVMKPRDPHRVALNEERARRDQALLSRWSAAKDFDAAYTVFSENRQALLRLVDFGGLRAALAEPR